MPDPINFTPTFKHVDWVDSIDRVRAGGGNGFNVRFHAIEDDLGTISQVIAAINAQLGPPVATEVTLTLTPTLVTTGVMTGPDNSNPWAHGPGYAQKLPGVTSAAGMMSVALPNGVQILSFRATGINNNAPTSSGLQIALNRFAVGHPVNPATETPDQLLAISVTSGGSYDRTITPTTSADPRFTVDVQNFRYFITAVLLTPGTNPAQIVTVNTFQIMYQ